MIFFSIEPFWKDILVPRLSSLSIEKERWRRVRFKVLNVKGTSWKKFQFIIREHIPTVKMVEFRTLWSTLMAHAVSIKCVWIFEFQIHINTPFLWGVERMNMEIPCEMQRKPYANTFFSSILNAGRKNSSKLFICDRIFIHIIHTVATGNGHKKGCV